MGEQTKTLKIKLVKGLIGCSDRQRRVASALGLRKTNQVVEHSGSPQILGMVRKIQHLIQVEAV